MCFRRVCWEILGVLGPQQGNRRGSSQSHNYSNHEDTYHSKGIEEFFGEIFLHLEVHPKLSINHFSFHQITQEGTKFHVGWGTADSLSKATTNYEKPPYGVSPNPKKAVIALFGLKPICHRCFDRPRRWRQYRTTGLLRDLCSKGCGDPLS